MSQHYANVVNFKVVQSTEDNGKREKFNKSLQNYKVPTKHKNITLYRILLFAIMVSWIRLDT